jgi:rhodanese-related sulfurtransferase
MKPISCDALKRLIDEAESCALLDIREPGEYNSGHIPGATSLPRRDIEFRIARLVPVRSTCTVIVGGSDERSSLAAKTLRLLGYENVFELERGFSSWIASARPKATGVNVPSKDFGERIHLEEEVPEIEPERLHKLVDEGVRVVVLDVRTPDEYGRFCIPGGLNVPGGDLILWAADLRKDPETKVVINCAGRTRSIIGTQSLRRVGLKNVFALKNGTMGWLLAGLELEQKPARGVPRPSPMSRLEAEKQAERIAAEEGVPLISISELQNLLARADSSTLYPVDVRSAEEYGEGHIPGFHWIPGGQAIQRADDYAPVRAGTVVFACDGMARSVMAAYWYGRMGFKDARALAGGTRAWLENGLRLEKGEPPRNVLGLPGARSSVSLITIDDLSSLMGRDENPAILDVSLSSECKSGHLPGARWISRGWLEPKIPEIFPDRNEPLVVTCPDGEQSTFAAAALQELRYRRVSVLKGGIAAWRNEGKPLETGLTRALVEPQDAVLSASLTGDQEAMRRYLEWEIALGKKYEKRPKSSRGSYPTSP